MLRRNLDAWGVATMSALMWLGMSLLLGGLGPFTWIGAVVLFVGQVVRFGGTPADDVVPDEGRSSQRKRPGKRGKRSIYGPPE